MRRLIRQMLSGATAILQNFDFFCCCLDRASENVAEIKNNYQNET